LKGIYVLIIQINKPVRIKVGALGEIAFEPSLYAYVGSAQNNLESRVKRHLRKEKRLFWHIDYLLADPAANVTEVYCLEGDKTCECKIAQLLSEHGESVTRFGCSDCRCNSHLFYSESFALLKKEMHLLDAESQ
jgi:Uri superfamily endonuclease